MRIGVLVDKIVEIRNIIVSSFNWRILFSRIKKIGNDPETDGSVFCGSVLIDDLMIAGE